VRVYLRLADGIEKRLSQHPLILYLTGHIMEMWVEESLGDGPRVGEPQAFMNRNAPADWLG
jgi:hypothetical protein